MTESKVLSIRLKTEIYEDFESLCARNKKSKKDILMECITLLLKAEKCDLPQLNVPEQYQPLENVSMDRRDEKYVKSRKD